MSELKAQLLLNRSGTQTRAEIAHVLSLSRPALVDLARIFHQRGVAVDGLPQRPQRAAGRPSIPLVPCADYLTTAGAYEARGTLTVTVRQFGGNRLADLTATLDGNTDRCNGEDRYANITSQAVRLIKTHVPDLQLDSLAVCSSTQLPTRTVDAEGEATARVHRKVNLDVGYPEIVSRLTPSEPGRRAVVLTNSAHRYRATLLPRQADGVGATEESVGQWVSEIPVLVHAQESGAVVAGRWGPSTNLMAWLQLVDPATSSATGDALQRVLDFVVSDRRRGHPGIDSLVEAFASGLSTMILMYEADEVVLAASPWTGLWQQFSTPVMERLAATGLGHISVRACEENDLMNTRSALLAEAASETTIVQRWQEA
jgi:hypothetical protein